MIGVGVLAAVLQTWLWTFPMAPDPSGIDPNGVTTAPKLWRRVHRGMGYIFALIYLVLAIQMIPRVWNFESVAWSATTLIHSLFGLGVGALLGIKIWILRRAQRHGKKLPYFGWGMVVFSLVVMSLVYQPVREGIVRPSVSDGVMTQQDADQARQIVFKNCIQCHGLSIVAGPHDDDWMHILEEMAENAEKRGIPDPSQGQRALIANYLAATYGAGAESDENSEHGRGRGRGRNRGDDD
ncbi:MAG: hypothetical protein KF824_07265 [Fimbriimonadaceae bacterium]|nr:MAG: hypothetical protein KF824_07265 [Fimbriimonadaceae bacterium]